MLKWIALAMLVVGLAAVIHAISRNDSASFDDGSFISFIVEAVGGLALIVIGFVIMGTLFFVGL